MLRRPKGLAAPDEHTLKITIDAPKAYFLAKLTYPTAYARLPGSDRGEGRAHR